MNDETATGRNVGLSAGLCGCRQCLRDRDEHMMLGPLKVPAECSRMILCAICGNKRCPHATDHNNPCTGSNAPGQVGSAYENCLPHNGDFSRPSEAKGGVREYDG